MKETIYSIALLLYCIFAFTIFISYIVKRKKITSKGIKVLRNLAVVTCICAIVACFTITGFSFKQHFICPVLAVPIWLFTAININKIMLNQIEIERIKEEYLKTQPIDVEYKELG